jgi:Reverse transcriptase (RNA-dependent DNA polymerase)
MNSDLTLLVLLYYVILSICTELLAVDCVTALRRWWNKPFKRNRRSPKKVQPQRRSRLLRESPTPGYKREKRHHRVRRARLRGGRGKSPCKRYYYLYYFYYIYILLYGTAVRSTAGRKIYACTSTSTLKIQESFGTEDTSTETYDSDSSWIGIDSLSTYCITNSVHDFTEPPTKIRQLIKGINSTPAHVTNVGKGVFKILDSQGRHHNFQIDKLYYCATSPMKIISPQHLDKMWKNKNSSHRLMSAVDSDGCMLQWTYKNKIFNKFIPINKRTGVPMFNSSPGYKRIYNYIATHPELNQDDHTMRCLAAHVIKDDKSISVETVRDAYKLEYPPMTFEGAVTPKRSNVTIKTPTDRNDPVIIEFGDEDIKEQPLADSSSMDPTSEMLFLHYKLGHISFSKIKQMAHDGLLPKRFLKCRVPTCASCMYGAATKRPWRTKHQNNQIQQNRRITAPGHCVSIDQFESPVPGMIAHIKGKPTTSRYKCGTVFVDHYSDVTYVHFQKKTSAAETIEAKVAFERWSASNGVKIQHYHADNGRFAENAFMNHIDQCNQTISFCGVNAHFQNGRAERRIRTLQELARCQLLHAKLRWPTAISTCLWPYAIKNVVDILNDTPNKFQKVSRTENFAKTEVRPNLRHHHHFGVPVYVLDNKAQAGFKLNKWAAKARIGIYLGKSPRHSRSIALVLNPQTGHVSPQFHVKFDDVFETVKGVMDELHGRWKVLCGFTSTEMDVNTKFDSKTTNTDRTTSTRTNHKPAHSPLTNNDFEGEIPSVPPPVPVGEDQDENQEVANPFQPEGATQHEGVVNTNTQVAAPTAAPTRRSSRAWKPTQSYLESIQQEDLALSTLPVCMELLYYDGDEEEPIENPMGMIAKADEDTMYWDQAMKAPDAKEFLQAAFDEIQTHEDNKHWEVIPIEDLPKNTPVLDPIWSMKRKRRLKTNEVYKHKARLNIHGGQQEYGVNYWETYAPVVTWAAIRLLLVLALMYGWTTIQIDFILAYPQAEVECPLYMKIPKGFTIQNGDRNTHVLRILRNLYGQKQAGRVWNQHLHRKLLELGWVQSIADDCVYYKGNVLFVVYVDDGILLSPSPENVRKCLEQMHQHFKITEEGDLCDYVGVNIEKKNDGTIHMTQPQLIKGIIKELNFNRGTKPTKIPAYSTSILSAGTDSPPHKADWNYRRIIGKLNFLEKSCRPEIACAVHQCARFSANPKTNHTDAVKRIVRYLTGTENKGIIYKPNDHSFEVFADADYCGLWDKSIAMEDPTTAKSRTGYIVMYAGCPIIWASQLQPEIAQSVTESEYISLSQALRQTIPLMRLVKELKEKLDLPMDVIPKVQCKLFEDNSGALELANVPKMRPRTKHINAKYHHFRQYVADKTIQVLKVSTKDQLADILTKNLNEELFLKFRKLICGW